MPVVERSKAMNDLLFKIVSSRPCGACGSMHSIQWMDSDYHFKTKFRCSSCGKSLVVSPDSNSHALIAAWWVAPLNEIKDPKQIESIDKKEFDGW